jgi:hypothetical protein
MTIPKYTLIHYSPAGRKLLGKKADAGRVGTKRSAKRSTVRIVLKAKTRGSRSTLLGFLASPTPSNAPARRNTGQSRPIVQTVGVWDLGAWLSNLPKLVEALNRAQKTIVFYEVKATVPAGMISRPERMISWLSEILKGKLKKSDKDQIKDNVIANDFFDLAEPIRKDVGTDYLVGITPSMVAWDEPAEGVSWNLFSAFSRRTIIASTFQLREFAAATQRPFEAFLGGIIVAQLLVAKFYPKLGFHDDTGCLFDYCEDRVSIQKHVKDLKIEPKCLRSIGPKFRPAALALVDVLREFKTKD